LNKKMLILAVLVLATSMLAFLPATMAQGQSSVNIASVSPSTGAAGAELTVHVTGSIETNNGMYVLFLNSNNVTQGNATGYSIDTEFTVYSIVPGHYNITLHDVDANIDYVYQDYHVAAEGLAAIPTATLLIMLVAVVISFANMALNRALITKMIGWREYRSMQKEMAEYNAQRMAAVRANDTKTLERLKKKESQIQAMQTKLFKPQMLLLPITFIYLIIWPALIGVFPFFVAYIPGFGAQSFFIWYLICSFFFGTIVSRILGITPIQ
jgi:uncharacterized membrane protein (DUF106 family)